MSAPKPEHGARFILRLFVEKFNCRPGEVLGVRNFILAFNTSPWRSQDFKVGMEFAAEQNWVQVLPGGSSFRLTEEGYEAYGEPMNIADECNEEVTIERADGSRAPQVPARVNSDLVIIPDVTLPIQVGDRILRQLPSKLIERYVVHEPGFFAGDADFPSHYQVKVRREGVAPEGTNNHYYYMSGDNARVNNNSVDMSTNTVTHFEEDLSVLAAEMSKLRNALLLKAGNAEDYAAIGAVSNAEIAAKSGDRSKVKAALSAVGSAGKWVLAVAKDIGVEVAAKALAESLKG